MILRFACLSVAIHATALVGWHVSTQPWSLAAPELRVTLAAAESRAALAPRPNAVAARPARSTREAPAVPVTEPSPGAESKPSYEVATDFARIDHQENEEYAHRANHMRALLYTALDRYFVYPMLARRHGWEGRVEVSLRLEADGRLSNLRLVRSSGYPILDLNAIDTLQRIGALPQTHAGATIPQEHVLLIVYHLLDG